MIEQVRVKKNLLAENDIIKYDKELLELRINLY